MKVMKSDLTQEYIKDLLFYSKKTGVFTWKKNISNVIKGSEAGSFDGNGYIRIKINRKDYRAHRLAWLYVTGNWPEKLLDHINGDKSDNSFKNIRNATYTDNNRNSILNKKSKSGYKGVSWRKKEKTWYARIRIGRDDADKLGMNGNCLSLGFHETAIKAHEAYKKASIKYHGEFANFG